MSINEKIKNLKSKTVEELQTHKIDLLKNQFNLRMRKGAGRLNQNHEFKKIRREIARINTVLCEKQKTIGI